MNANDGCRNCRYFHPPGYEEAECRRYPPRPRIDGKMPDDPGVAFVGEWPRVSRDQFCGEWERRADHEDK